MNPNKRVQRGDVIEVPVATGLAYAQFINEHATWGQLICVFDEIHISRPLILSDIVYGQVRFKVFFPFSTAVSMGVFEVIGSGVIAEWNREFPVFRDGVADNEGRVRAWWLWDGTREWRIEQLTPAQRTLPFRELLNDAMLVSRIEKNWRPETDHRH